MTFDLIEMHQQKRAAACFLLNSLGCCRGRGALTGKPEPKEYSVPFCCSSATPQTDPGRELNQKRRDDAFDPTSLASRSQENEASQAVALIEGLWTAPWWRLEVQKYKRRASEPSFQINNGSIKTRNIPRLWLCGGSTLLRGFSEV